MMPCSKPVLFSLAAVVLTACGPVFPRAGAGDGPNVGVTLRSGGAEAIAMPACTVARGPSEIAISLYDPDGLAAAEVSFAGTLAPEGVQMNPGGEDIALTESAGAGDARVRVRFTPVVQGQVRTSVVLSLETAAPHTGRLTISATDQTGAGTTAGPFVLAGAGGCAG